MTFPLSASVVKRALVVAAFAAALLISLGSAAERRVLLIAGPPSHGPGEHEHNAGVLLLQKCLSSVPELKTSVSLNGWPTDPAVFDGVDAVVFISDGGRRHPALQANSLSILQPLIARGIGFALIHFAIEPTANEGKAEFLQWAGGFFETNWSVNPLWEATFEDLPSHPITRGVRPFTLKDEWYYHLRFAEDKTGFTPLLVAIPTAETLTRPDGPHEGNPAVRAAVAREEPQILSWALERADGGRSFGFTGGHFHRNWAHDDFRKLVLNGIAWIAKVEVPTKGIASAVTADDLEKNLDEKKKKPAPKP